MDFSTTYREILKKTQKQGNTQSYVAVSHKQNIMLLQFLHDLKPVHYHLVTDFNKYLTSFKSSSMKTENITRNFKGQPGTAGQPQPVKHILRMLTDQNQERLIKRKNKFEYSVFVVAPFHFLGKVSRVCLPGCKFVCKILICVFKSGAKW